MLHVDSDKKRKDKNYQDTKSSYVVPQIIYEGKIGIRAGSPEASIPGVLPETESMPFNDPQN